MMIYSEPLESQLQWWSKILIIIVIIDRTLAKMYRGPAVQSVPRFVCGTSSELRRSPVIQVLGCFHRPTEGLSNWHKSAQPVGSWAGIQAPVCWREAQALSHQPLLAFLNRGCPFPLRLCIPAQPFVSQLVLENRFSLSEGSVPSPAIWGQCIAPACKKALWGTQEIGTGHHLSGLSCCPSPCRELRASKEAVRPRVPDVMLAARDSGSLLPLRFISASCLERDLSTSYWVFMRIFGGGLEWKRGCFLGKMNTFDFYVIKSIHNIFPRFS